MRRNLHVTRIQKILAAQIYSYLIALEVFITHVLYETGLSDFHKLFVTILRTGFEPLPPKIFKYRNLKNSDEDKFGCLFKKRLNDFNTDDVTVDVSNMTFFNVQVGLHLKKRNI